MISLVRVDDRLIHGQITVGWVPYLHADRVAVVNDHIASNPVLTAIVRAGAIEGVKIDVISLKDAAKLFAAGDFDEGRAIVLFESLADVLVALEEGLGIETVNLGGVRGAGEGVRLGDAVFLTQDDSRIVGELSRRGVKVEMRLMPRDRSVPVCGEGRE